LRFRAPTASIRCVATVGGEGDGSRSESLSQYRYYKFVAVDRPLDAGELGVPRGLSTRAHITPTSFVNTYEWDNFRGEPRVLVKRYFDAFRYLANWGSCELILRSPARLIDLDTAQLPRRRRGAGTERRGAGTERERERDRFRDVQGRGGGPRVGWQGVLASILPVRAELLAGDRAGAVSAVVVVSVRLDEVDDRVVESAVLEWLDRLTGSQAALAVPGEFPQIDRDLLDVAVGGSPRSRRHGVDVAGWVESLDRSERDALIEGNDPLPQVETLRRARPYTGERVGVRPAGRLPTAAAVRREEREREERERWKSAAAE
jgi:hypothetical protein